MDNILAISLSVRLGAPDDWSAKSKILLFMFSSEESGSSLILFSSFCLCSAVKSTLYFFFFSKLPFRRISLPKQPQDFTIPDFRAFGRIHFSFPQSHLHSQIPLVPRILCLFRTKSLPKRWPEIFFRVLLLRSSSFKQPQDFVNPDRRG